MTKFTHFKIPADLYDEIDKTLESYISEIQDNCGTSGCLCDLSSSGTHSKPYEDLLSRWRTEAEVVEE